MAEKSMNINDLKRTLQAVCQGFIMNTDRTITSRLNTISNMINQDFIPLWKVKNFNKIKLILGDDGPKDENFVYAKFNKITQQTANDVLAGKKTFYQLFDRGTLVIVVNRNVIEQLNMTGDLWMVIRDYVKYIDMKAGKDLISYAAYISAKGVVFKQLLSTRLYREIVAGIIMISTLGININKNAVENKQTHAFVKYAGLNRKWGKDVAIESLRILEASLVEDDPAFRKSVVETKKKMGKAFKEYLWDDNIEQLQYLYEGLEDLYEGDYDADIRKISLHFIAENVESNHVFQERVFVKKLKKLSMEIIGYVLVNGETMKDGNDKMLIIGYAYSKLDIADFYIELIDSQSKKYIVPHTKEYLVNFKTKLLEAIQKVMDTKLPTQGSVINVNYPKGYEG